MPEGPSIVILTELAHSFEGRTIAAASGNSKAVPFDELPGQPILSKPFCNPVAMLSP